MSEPRITSLRRLAGQSGRLAPRRRGDTATSAYEAEDESLTEKDSEPTPRARSVPIPSQRDPGSLYSSASVIAMSSSTV
jgi:hypothetical protein